MSLEKKEKVPERENFSPRGQPDFYFAAAVWKKGRKFKASPIGHYLTIIFDREEGRMLRTKGFLDRVGFWSANRYR